MPRSVAAFVSWLILQVTVPSNALNITSDSFFFGQSPPVYPSPPTLGTGEWSDAVQKAKIFVSQLTQDEKNNLTCGITRSNGCAGNIAAIPRLGFDGMCLVDGPHGVHSTDFVNAYPSEIHVGAR
jgi:beta-glucosidase